MDRESAEMKRKRAERLTWLLIGAGMLIHGVYVFLLFTKVPLNSDHASQVLQAADMLSGNWLLKGWNLTGVSFYFSELPFYVLGTTLFGISTNAYIFAAALMAVLLFCAAFPLCRVQGQRVRLSDFLLYCALAGMPTLEWLGYLRGHCAIFIYACAGLYCLKRLLEGAGPAKWLSMLGVLLTLGCMSDMQLFIILVIPLCIFCVWNLLRGERQARAGLYGKLVVLSLGAAGLGCVLDAGLMRLGGINKNSFLDTRKFLDLSQIEQKAALLLEGILKVYKGDFSRVPLFSWTTLRCFLVGLILCLAMGLVIDTLRRFVCGKAYDPLNVLICFSLIVMTLLCFFTDIYTNLDSPRYLAYFPFFTAVLIVRCAGIYHWREFRLAGGKLPLGCVLSAAALLLMAAFLQPLRWGRVVTPQDRLALFLEDNGLRSGYSDFWNASAVTVSSHDRVRVRAIRVHAQEIGKPVEVFGQNWFCKTEWYRPDFANFIAFDGKAYLDVREDYIEMLLGSPQRILENGEYRVFVYDRDISKEIPLQ